ncbi:MAG: hypothetical protein ACOX1L_05555 [Erysipelotrichaceae bacterium]|jgi:hypothetical protein
MEFLKTYFKDLMKEINGCNLIQLIIVVLCGALGVLWPLGGIIVFLFSKITTFKTYGKVALTTALIRVFMFGFGQGVKFLISN